MVPDIISNPDITARQMRVQLLEHLCLATNADCASFAKVVRIEQGGLVLSGITAVGPADYVEAIAKREGLQISSIELDLADLSSVNTFELQLQDDFSPRLRKSFFQPLNLNASLSMLAARGGRLLGYVGLFRVGDHPTFTELDLGRANAEARAARMILETAESREPHTPSASGTFLFSTDGTVRYRSVHAPKDDLVTLEIGHLVRAYAAGQGRADQLLGGTLVSMELLHGADEQLVLLTTTPAQAPDVPDPLTLSPLKRRIVSFAVQGATVAEIARTLDRSPETVRAHIKQVYQRLGIGSRVELAEICHHLFD